VRSDIGAYGGGDSATIAIDDFTDRVPIKFDLLQNYPNPFNSSTAIRYSLPEQSDICIEIFNILGQRVTALFYGKKQSGYHTVTWQANDCRSGIYFARLKAGMRIDDIKMVLLK
jgi:hypothetical protein